MCTNIVSVVKSSSLTALSFRAIAISTNETDRYEPGDAEKIVHIDEIWALQHMVVDKYIVQTLEEARALEYATAEIMAARGYLPDARSCHTYAVVVRGLDFQQLESINHPPRMFKADWSPEQDLQRLEARAKQAVQEHYWGDELCKADWSPEEMDGDKRPWGDEPIRVRVHTCEKLGLFKMDDVWRLEDCVDLPKRGPKGEYFAFEDECE